MNGITISKETASGVTAIDESHVFTGSTSFLSSTACSIFLMYWLFFQEVGHNAFTAGIGNDGVGDVVVLFNRQDDGVGNFNAIGQVNDGRYSVVEVTEYLYRSFVFPFGGTAFTVCFDNISGDVRVGQYAFDTSFFVTFECEFVDSGVVSTASCQSFTGGQVHAFHFSGTDVTNGVAVGSTNGGVPVRIRFCL